MWLDMIQECLVWKIERLSNSKVFHMMPCMFGHFQSGLCLVSVVSTNSYQVILTKMMNQCYKKYVRVKG